MAKPSIEYLEDRTVPAVIFNGKVPLDLDVFIPKTGNTVHLSGTLHVVMEQTVDSAGGVHIKEHFQPQGITGIDFATGAKYQATGVTQDQEIDTANGASNFTFIN